MNKEKNLYLLFVIIFVLLIFYSNFIRVYYYILDLSISILIISFLFLFYKKFKLDKSIFVLIFIALLLHNFGLFGFYNNSPIYFSYDKLTHFFGGFALNFMFLNYLKAYFNKSKQDNIILAIFSILITLGVGSIIEIIEYLGYIILGQGEGFFYFGGTGDLGINQDSFSPWINSSFDMIFNLIGSLFGIIVYFIWEK